MGQTIRFQKPVVRVSVKPTLYSITWPKTSRPVAGIFLCQPLDIVQAPFHWDQSALRTVACAGVVKKCPYCVAGVGNVMRTFLACYQPRDGRKFGLSLADESWARMCEHHPLGTDLRGRPFIARRLGGPRGLVSVQIEDAREFLPGFVLPPCPDLTPTIIWLHGSFVQKALR